MGRSGLIKWPTTSAEAAHMNEMRARNRILAAHNLNERLMAEKLAATGLKWTPQATWGYRIFDFWNKEKGIAVEVDGPEHRPGWDKLRDFHNWEVSRILVLHVRNRNEGDAARALEIIAKQPSWDERHAANEFINSLEPVRFRRLGKQRLLRERARRHMRGEAQGELDAAWREQARTP